MLKSKIKVLIVDDSLVFREILARGISTDPNIEVVAKAVDPFDARDKIIEFEPDVMTCDVEMPGMNGIEFIKRLMPQYPIPIIVVSSLNNIVFDAMDAGAIDFVGKPNVQSVDDVKYFIMDLIEKIKAASIAKTKNQHIINSNSVNKEINCKNKIIAIGASTGGTEAIFNVLKELPSNMPGIVIVQHIPPIFSRMFAEKLNRDTALNVKEAETGDLIEQGKVFVSPGDKHMTVVKVGDQYKVECFNGEKVNGHCPSVDVLFDSVAKNVGINAIGIILTGMGYDGSKGILSMKRRGAKTIGQDEESSVVYGMPKVAYDIGGITKQLPLSLIPEYLCSLLK